MWFQREITLPKFERGFHLISHLIKNEIKPELSGLKIGIAHIHIKHTSASLTINENADPTVREDFENSINDIIKENQKYYKHTFEGPDDMPAHIKASLLGNSVSIPITNGEFNLGTWQGIYLCEHRNYGGNRSIVVTIHGD